ncbi:HAD family phosphatase [uncultured Tateyamaria sp.]|uniref:HAD family hydrolase n=1 Tax=uncultured Tateyamaria sp. TaxID=455651 RepID=UPI0026054DD4|nr:HAD family phosphatase [uncultured Tateyamaria sp.]
MFHHQGRTWCCLSDEWLTLFEAEGFTVAIFDCDGTLVDSMQAHLHAMQSAALEQGHEMSPDWYARRTGLDRTSLFAEFQQTVKGSFDVERAIVTSIECFYEISHLIRPIPAVLAFARSLQRKGIPLAVATNAERDVANASLSAVNATALFDCVVSISDDVRPKPSPEMFELAAHLLGLPPNKILVIEDSPQGVQAAISGGMSTIQLLEENRPS